MASMEGLKSSASLPNTTLQSVEDEAWGCGMTLNFSLQKPDWSAS
jgi:hypothetical protein